LREIFLPVSRSHSQSAVYHLFVALAGLFWAKKHSDNLVRMTLCVPLFSQSIACGLGFALEGYALPNTVSGRSVSGWLMILLPKVATDIIYVLSLIGSVCKEL
jgi:hypothetical protein